MKKKFLENKFVVTTIFVIGILLIMSIYGEYVKFWEVPIPATEIEENATIEDEIFPFYHSRLKDTNNTNSTVYNLTTINDWCKENDIDLLFCPQLSDYISTGYYPYYYIAYDKTQKCETFDEFKQYVTHSIYYGREGDYWKFMCIEDKILYIFLGDKYET